MTPKLTLILITIATIFALIAISILIGLYFWAHKSEYLYKISLPAMVLVLSIIQLKNRTAYK